MEADGESAYVTVFVQPDSEQQCLLGTNVLPALGLRINRANGEPLIVRKETEPIVAHVRLVQSSSILGMKGKVLNVLMEGVLPSVC